MYEFEESKKCQGSSVVKYIKVIYILATQCQVSAFGSKVLRYNCQMFVTLNGSIYSKFGNFSENLVIVNNVKRHIRNLKNRD